MDVSGKIVKTTTENLISKKLTINLAGLAKGIYFIHIHTATHAIIKKVVID